MSDNDSSHPTDQRRRALELLAAQYEKVGGHERAQRIRADDLSSSHAELAVRAIVQALSAAATVEPDTFFVKSCPGWPGGIEVFPSTLERALNLIDQHGDETTALATYCRQYQRRDYSPSETRELVDRLLVAPASH